MDPGRSARALAARHLPTLRPDILRDRFYVALERHNWLVWINLGQMPLFFAAGFAAAWLSGETPAARCKPDLAF